MISFNRSSEPLNELNFERLNRSLNAHIEMNSELKQRNEELKEEMIALQKELSQFKQEYREQPLSKLKVLQDELMALLESIDTIIDTSEEAVLEHLTKKSKEVCTSSFALLNRLKEFEDYPSAQEEIQT
ncbi:MAG: hypothetical protein ABFR02_07230 [Campylobacterota bacterium]